MVHLSQSTQKYNEIGRNIISEATKGQLGKREQKLHKKLDS